MTTYPFPKLFASEGLLSCKKNLVLAQTAPGRAAIFSREDSRDESATSEIKTKNKLDRHFHQGKYAGTFQDSCAPPTPVRKLLKGATSLNKNLPPPVGF
jgi:hypothetical protein